MEREPPRAPRGGRGGGGGGILWGDDRRQHRMRYDDEVVASDDGGRYGGRITDHSLRSKRHGSKSPSRSYGNSGGYRDRDRDRDRDRERDRDRSWSPDMRDRERRERDRDYRGSRRGRDRDRDYVRRRDDDRYDGRGGRGATRSKSPHGRGSGRHRRSVSPRGGRHKSRYNDSRSRSRSLSGSGHRSYRNGASTPIRDDTPHRSDGRDKDVEMGNTSNCAREGGEDDMETQMESMMGIAGFGTTKQKKVKGNNVYAVAKDKKSKYRQYMNRVGGFNRALSPC